MFSGNTQVTIDLEGSGLVITDLHARPLETPERAAVNVNQNINGYVIPYFTLYGRPQPFYRAKLFDHSPKYKQPKDTPSYVYFPPSFMAIAKGSPFIIITEGEKKAVLATKLGYPTVGLAGVDAWRNRTMVLPNSTELTKNSTSLKAKLPSGGAAIENTTGLATGVQDLIDFCMLNGKQIIFVYDSDEDVGIKADVQRACADFAFDLRYRGIPFSHIRQIVLPPINIEGPKSKDGKIGFDDYLLRAGKEKFQALLERCLKKKSAFPRHPAIRDYINKKLQRMNMTRKEMQQLSIAVLSDLDANGIRLKNTAEGQTYYFDFVTRKLFKTVFDSNKQEVSGTMFGQFLYKRYGLGGSDDRLLVWLGSHFTGEDPIEEVVPHRILARGVKDPHLDTIFYQLSDSQYAGVNAVGLEVYDNGENSILFEAEQVIPSDVEKLQLAYAKEALSPTPKNMWAEVLSTVRLKDQDKQKKMHALLYYTSPWLYRWRGMQLPAELIIGESGSGKSTLCEARLAILTGQTRLRNSPTDLKDWHASIANTGGLHVTDNVQLVDRSLRQRLSDEICRIITEPDPHIEMRRYYTNADLMRIPVRSVFAITAIQQPFQNADLIQRSIILDLDKTPSLGHDGGLTYDSNWREHQLQKLGGREGWIAHHLYVLHKFFGLVSKKWNSQYKAKHRLINFEQSLMLMAEVFGEDPSWLPDYLSGIVDKNLQEADWTFEGIKAFVDQNAHHYKDMFINANHICDWAIGQEDFEKCEMLINSRRLGRYMQTHKALIAGSIGIWDAGTRGNRQIYRIIEKEKPKKVRT